MASADIADILDGDRHFVRYDALEVHFRLLCTDRYDQAVAGWQGIALQGRTGVRHCASPRAYDLASLDDYRERQAFEEADRSRREEDDLS